MLHTCQQRTLCRIKLQKDGIAVDDDKTPVDFGLKHDDKLFVEPVMDSDETKDAEMIPNYSITIHIKSLGLIFPVELTLGMIKWVCKKDFTMDFVKPILSSCSHESYRSVFSMAIFAYRKNAHKTHSVVTIFR